MNNNESLVIGGLIGIAGITVGAIISGRSSSSKPQPQPQSQSQKELANRYFKKAYVKFAGDLQLNVENIGECAIRVNDNTVVYCMHKEDNDELRAYMKSFNNNEKARSFISNIKQRKEDLKNNDF